MDFSFDGDESIPTNTDFASCLERVLTSTGIDDVFSTFVTLRQGVVRWRDTFYSIEALRAGGVR